MQPSVAVPSRMKGNGNGHGPSQVVKRDGTLVNYDRNKIIKAISRCLSGDCKWPKEEAKSTASVVASQVHQILLVRKDPGVEQIQDLVEQQLMAAGLHEEAKRYILYREEHRKLREDRPVDPEIKSSFRRSAEAFEGPNQNVQMFQALDKFARFRHEDGRRETWHESVARVMDYTKKHVAGKFGDKFDNVDWSLLEESLLNLEASPAMRLIQMAGPALERCQTGVFNCSFQFLRNPTDLAEELYLLMQGCGVGFSVENQYAVEKWPRVKRQRKKLEPVRFVIPDSTEGWCDALKMGVEAWLDGRDVEYDFSLIRPEGAILRKKGGRASGPQPLKDLLKFTRDRILSRQGKYLSAIDLHDINCYVHRIVQMGGVRRASGISLSDLDDRDMRNCKSGEFWNKNPQRNQANNSAVYETKPSPLEFMEEWLSLAKSGSGERGIFNRGSLKKQMPKRRETKGHVFGCNPCGEIIQRHKQFCNLSIAVIRPWDTWEDIRRKVIVATVWGTIQATMTNFKYVGDEWKKNCEEECLLGVDLLGHMDHPLLQPGAKGLAGRLEELRDLAVDTNVKWADIFGINRSAAVTCGKPSGDSSVFFNCAPGFKAWHGEYYIRRVRASVTNPIAKMCKDQGVPCFNDYDKAGLVVLEFPCKAIDGGIVMGKMTAIEQLEHWKKYKVHFTEHNPSVTIFVKEHEWLEVGNWVYANWDIVGGLAFSPFDGGIYPLAPYETIDKAEYERRVAEMPKIEWWKLIRYEDSDMTEAAQQFACQGNHCEI